MYSFKNLIIFIFLIVFISTISAAKKEPQIRHIALSLNQLQTNVKRCVLNNQQIPDSIKTLGALNKPQGFLIDSCNNDIIIFGESVLPDELLLVDDIAAAVRNVFFLDTFPQCYINMRDEELEDYLLLLSELGSREIAEQKAIINWKQKKHSRDIIVRALPDNCHFSQILVNADCILKNFLHGNHRIRVRGLKPYIYAYQTALQKELEKFGPAETAYWHEFWLFPGNTRIFHNSFIYYFDTPVLKLYTEEELINNEKSYYAKQTKSDYVKLFNESYKKIKEKEPVFSTVEALNSLLLIVNQIKRNDFHKKSNFSPQFWGEHYTIKPYTIKKEIRTIYNDLYIAAEFGKPYTTRIEADAVVYYANLCIAGGILLDYKKNVEMVKVNPETYNKLKDSIISSRPAKESVFWEFSR